MQRSHLKPWDENVGPDASIVRVGGGKKVNTDAKAMLLASQVNLPIGAPLMIGDVDMPVRVPWSVASTKVNSDAHLWKSYRTLLTDPGDCRTQGKKMFTAKMSSKEFQDKIRQGVRSKSRLCLAKEEALRQEQIEERQSLRERHRAHREAEVSIYRQRCKTNGVEGLVRPSLRSPMADPKIPEEMIEAAMKKASVARGDGKRVIARDDAVSPPFGPPLQSQSVPMQRWEDKCVV